MARKRQIKKEAKSERKKYVETQPNYVIYLIREMILHWIFSEAILEDSFPSLLYATHRYCPLSVLLKSNIVILLLSNEKRILGLSRIGDPSLVHDIVGSGFPSA